MKVFLIAAPLTARSGVYNSLVELVEEARKQGLAWTGLTMLRPEAAKQPGVESRWVETCLVEPRSVTGLWAIRRELRSRLSLAAPDAIVSMIPQTDVVLSTMRLNAPRVSYVRGLPWPDTGERSTTTRAIWKAAVKTAMAGSTEVWTTTEILRDQIGGSRHVSLVPPGLSANRDEEPLGLGEPYLVWAGRFTAEKRPDYFLRLAEDAGYSGVMFGEGPMEEGLLASAPPTVTLRGWVPKDQLWSPGAIYVGTSRREAFGRSVVEAALRGAPVILSDQYGCAPFLFKDPELAAHFVLPLDDHAAWVAGLHLLRDADMRTRVADHVRANAQSLTVDRAVGTIDTKLSAIIANRRSQAPAEGNPAV